MHEIDTVLFLSRAMTMGIANHLLFEAHWIRQTADNQPPPPSPPATASCLQKKKVLESVIIVKLHPTTPPRRSQQAWRPSLRRKRSLIAEG